MRARSFSAKRGKQVQDKRVNVRTKLGDQEGHLVGHEPRDEVNVAAEAIQLGDGYVAPEFPRGG